MLKTSHLAKLTPKEVRQIRKWLKEGLSQNQICERLHGKVSGSSIHNIRTGKTYKRVA